MFQRLRLFPITTQLVIFVPFAVCVYFGLSFLFLVLSNFWPGPIFDYWSDIPLIDKYFNHQPILNDLIIAHNNAHRILIPRLLFILDYQFFSGTNVLLISASLLCKFFIIVLFNNLIKDQALKIKILLNSLIFAAILNASTVYNVLYNFDIQWDLVSVFACYSIYFYVQVFDNACQKKLFLRCLAYLFLCFAFLSHAGGLSIPFVFIFISLLYRNSRELIINIILTATIFYANSILPVDMSGSGASNALATILSAPNAVFVFFIKCISGFLLFNLGPPALYFSIYLLILFILSSIFSRKTCSIYNNSFFFISVFLVLMIVSIAAARTAFSHNVWGSSRFQTTVLLFMLTIQLHVWLAAPILFRPKLINITRQLITVHALGMLFIVQYFTYNIPFKLSNAMFYSQAYMLTHARNHTDGSRLLLWIHEKDEIADSDPLFRKNGFAYYANKQGGSNYKDFTDTEKTLVTAGDIAKLENTCTKVFSPLSYLLTQENGIEFSIPLDSHFLTLLNRNTYYALNNDGLVVGSAYIFINEDGFFKKPELRGYSIDQSITYIAEIRDDQPHCLYALQNQLTN